MLSQDERERLHTKLREIDPEERAAAILRPAMRDHYRPEEARMLWRMAQRAFEAAQREQLRIDAA